MKQFTWRLLGITFIALLVMSQGTVTQGVARIPSGSPSRIQTQADNLLKNGSMEEGFYWKPPNHYIAEQWNRWWIHLTVLPEYDDTRIQRPHYDGEHAQTYFKWGSNYHAGIYQVVSGLTPCTPYRLTMWARNHSLAGALPHAKIGLDPKGTQLTSGPSEGAILALPASTIWSPEQTQLNIWEQLSVEAESLGSSLTAILYANPTPGSSEVHYFDTFWDAGNLAAFDFPGGKLPAPPSSEPSGFINGVVSQTVSGQLTITWETLESASTQVWYTVYTPTPPTTPTTTYTHTTYLPWIGRGTSIQDLNNFTPLNLTPVTHHQVTIGSLQSGQIVSFIVLSRRPTGEVCQTASSAILQAQIP